MHRPRCCQVRQRRPRGRRAGDATTALILLLTANLFGLSGPSSSSCVGHPYDDGRLPQRGAGRWAGGNVPTTSFHSQHPVDLGTTLVAIKCKDGVVVGADTRTSVSNYVSHRFAEKVSVVAPHVVVARSGSAADTQHLAEQVRLDVLRRSYKYGMSPQSFPPSTFAHYLKNAVYASASEMSASLIVAGFDGATNQPKIYTIAPSGALLEESRYAMAGSGSTLITGFLDEQLSSSTECLPTEHDAVELCRKAIELAIQRDGSSGGVARIYVCDASGVRDVTATSRATSTGSDSHNSDMDRSGASAPKELVGFAPPAMAEASS